MKRDANIELFRVLLTFGIVFLHTQTFGGYCCKWLQCVFHFCVVGFVFISGWFGIKFSFYKLVKLYGIVLYCALIAGGIYYLFNGNLMGDNLGGGLNLFMA